ANCQDDAGCDPQGHKTAIASRVHRSPTVVVHWITSIAARAEVRWVGARLRPDEADLAGSRLLCHTARSCRKTVPDFSTHDNERVPRCLVRRLNGSRIASISACA